MAFSSAEWAFRLVVRRAHSVKFDGDAGIWQVYFKIPNPLWAKSVHFGSSRACRGSQNRNKFRGNSRWTGMWAATVGQFER